MVELVNPARRRLEAGELSLGVGLRLARTVDIAKIMKSAGMDWLFIDLEHGAMDLDTAAQIAVAALDTGIAPLVRVPRGDYATASRIMDSGALGIVMPHVDTVEEAREVADRLRQPPEGHRGVGSATPHFDFLVPDFAAAIAALNAAMLVVVMLETEDAVARADAIAAVPGIDVVMIGTNDLATEMGIPRQFDHPRIVAAYETVSAACRAHGKWMGMGGVSQPELIERYVGMGVRFVLTGVDTGLLLNAARAVSERIRAFG